MLWGDSLKNHRFTSAAADLRRTQEPVEHTIATQPGSRRVVSTAVKWVRFVYFYIRIIESVVGARPAQFGGDKCGGLFFAGSHWLVLYGGLCRRVLGGIGGVLVSGVRPRAPRGYRGSRGRLPPT